MSTKSNTRQPKCKTYTEQATSIDRQIERAEAQNTFDTILAEKRIEIEARAVYDTIMVTAPDFITYGLLRLLNDAANSKGLPIPDWDEQPEATIKSIANIFTVARDYKLPTKGSAEELAQAIATIINHPLTPANLHNAMADELADLDDYDNRNTPAHFERALVAYHAAKSKGALITKGGTQ